VAAIHSMAQATLAAKSLPDSKDRALQLVDETRRAVRMTNQMLSLEQLRGRNLKFSSNDINVVIKDLTSRLAPKALKRDIDFNVNLLNETKNTLFDPILISEAITNLIENALQHGGKQLSKITINVLIEGKFIKIEVENDGQKLLASEIKACFERFSQIGENPGAGLGLALVKEIAEIHNGSVNVVVFPQMKFTFYMAISS
jgi:two-component system sensor histidine kinase TctE